ncbi:hypothetical protein EOD39_19979 [Acipenser ruthenus]|uniref:Uncharacterized protein n=1 Tax=Acipenser ruthenus TaxID=7906 RepID=A0A444UWM4_ACIRT|nr:hypothetical protein EOD39_19979 [Acipenser ruthenus]
MHSRLKARRKQENSDPGAQQCQDTRQKIRKTYSPGLSSGDTAVVSVDRGGGKEPARCSTIWGELRRLVHHQCAAAERQIREILRVLSMSEIPGEDCEPAETSHLRPGIAVTSSPCMKVNRVLPCGGNRNLKLGWETPLFSIQSGWLTSEKNAF